jgi:dCMP deaminase
LRIKKGECMRPTWEEYFISVLDAVSLRGSCDRGRCGAVLVRDNRILATGYVGAPSGLPTCEDEGHQLVRRCIIPEKYFHNNYTIYDTPPHEFTTHCVRTVHAEINAILNCARNGVSTLDSTLYVGMTPCPTCAMAIIQAGIEEVVAKNQYQKGSESIEMFNKVGIKYKTLNESLLY